MLFSLEMLNNFSEMKEELNNKLATANILLEEERAKYSHDIEMLENRFLVEREKMKRNFELNFEAAKRELESTVDKKLSGKVRNTQVMNVLVRKELESQVNIWLLTFSVHIVKASNFKKKKTKKKTEQTRRKIA